MILFLSREFLKIVPMKTLLSILILCLISINGVTAKDYKNSGNWNFLVSKLFNGNAYVSRFHEDIKLQVSGKLTHGDSIHINNLVTELNELIDVVEVKQVEEEGNIKLGLSPSNGSTMNYSVNFQSYENIDIRLFFNHDQNQSERNQAITYYVIRSLVRLNVNLNNNTMIRNTIFEEHDAVQTSFTDQDKFIIANVYSEDFYERLKENYGKKRGFLSVYKLRFPKELKLLLLITAIFLFILMILLAFHYRFINLNNSKWLDYMKFTLLIIIGFLLLGLSDALYSIIGFKEIVTQLYYTYRHIILKEIALLNLALIVSINLLYSLEKLIIKSKNNLFSLLITHSTTSVTTGLVFIWITRISVYSNWQQLVNVTIIISVIILIRIAWIFLRFKSENAIKQKDIELATLRELKTKAELQALHSRINPHFLYNSLNSVASLAHINADKTEQMALSLSDFFRYAINREQKDMVTVKEEIEIVETYLEIEKVRLGDRLLCNFNIDPSCLKLTIPRFLIQPLVENAIKHGIGQITENGILNISITKDSTKLIISIADNGPDFPDTPVSGYGLQSLHDKLNLLYNGLASISWENGNNKHIEITLPLQP
ncbi:hypothetical protein EYV94_26530 [Puteibacter caeruleilacunae]|nr:hypothetical protein EYV94_26530 [Puteibacter caeruleilacunae]